jgi:hypothetical protein
LNEHNYINISTIKNRSTTKKVVQQKMVRQKMARQKMVRQKMARQKFTQNLTKYLKNQTTHSEKQTI